VFKISNIITVFCYAKTKKTTPKAKKKPQKALRSRAKKEKEKKPQKTTMF
jgi:hypothetical protein